MVEWVDEKLKNRIVKNVPISKVLEIFGNQRIELEKWLLVSIGVRDNKKCFEFFHLLANTGTLFYGCHKVQWNGNEYDVSSLSSLRSNFFHFSNKKRNQLSFERSTFIVVPYPFYELIRLQKVRALLKCPVFECTIALKAPSLTTMVRKQIQNKGLKNNSIEVMRQLDGLVYRHLLSEENTEKSITDSLLELQTTITNHLDNLILIISKVQIPEVIDVGMEVDDDTDEIL